MPRKAWNKGKKTPEHVKKKIGAALKGRDFPHKYIGKPEGSTMIKYGYRYIKIKGSWILEHHYVWCRYSEWGFIPEGFIVHHINGDKLDNRIENLSCLPRDIHAAGHAMLQENLIGQNAKVSA